MNAVRLVGAIMVAGFAWFVVAAGYRIHADPFEMVIGVAGVVLSVCGTGLVMAKRKWKKELGGVFLAAFLCNWGLGIRDLLGAVIVAWPLVGSALLFANWHPSERGDRGVIMGPVMALDTVEVSDMAPDTLPTRPAGGHSNETLQ